MFLNGTISCSKWAEQISKLIKKTVSKQDIWKRVNDCFVNFTILCLENFMFQQDKEEIQGYTKAIRNKLFGFFGNVFIQDSTNLSLPIKFAKHYKGSVVKGKQTAGAKLQIIFEVTTNTIKQLTYIAAKIQNLLTKQG
jgi:hypothetical protein